MAISPRARAEKEREDFKDSEKETLPQKQRNKERSDWQDGESETGPDELRRNKNKGSGVSVQWKQLNKEERVCQKDWLLSQWKKEKQGFCS